MKPTVQISKRFSILILGFTLLFISISLFSIAQSKGSDQVKVKIVKIVDGKTTTIEKTMDEASVKDFTKQFEDVKGKNVQIMITIEGADQEKNSSSRSSCQSSCPKSGKGKCASSMNFNFDMDSATAHSFSKMFMFNDSSAGTNFVWNDSMMKNLPKNFDFNFNFNDDGDVKDFDFDINTDKNGKTVIIKNNGGKTIVINGDGNTDGVTESESDNGNTRTKTKTIVIDDDKTKNKKKVIVSTSVMVIDMDDEKSEKRKSKGEENNFSFYPNPSDGNFTLDLDLNGKEDASVRITDLDGKEIYNEKISGAGKTSKSVNLGTDKKGTFIVTIKQGKKTTSKKIIIE
jgi:hypothetical protein